ncbi:MAG TPA: muramidase [Clostridiaceae bacterium]|nr:muramidase [Clostridiaceae bacterium]
MINPINSDNNIQMKAALDNAKATQDQSFEEMLQKASAGKDEAKLREACANLESVFLNMMFKSMRNTVEKSDLMGESFATGVYEDMLYEKFAEEASKGKGLGLGELLYKQLSANIKRDEEE